jgi:hypothetical protein
VSGDRLRTLVYGLRHLRRPADLTALRAAGSAQELARLAIVPAARNLGISAAFLPAALRAEFTAALLACRVLDAHEDLVEHRLASSAVLAAAAYLNGTTDTPPSPPVPPEVALRDSEAVDLALAERIGDVRALLRALPAESRQRVSDMLADVAGAMAHNLESPVPRTVYGRNVLGRVVHYVSDLITGGGWVEADSRELAECLGVMAQLANDLRDREFALYGVGDREELKLAVMVRLLAPALGGFALLERMSARIPSRGARMAMAYMMITTPAFLCTSVGAPAAYPRRLRLGAAVLAALSPRRWTAMSGRVRCSIDAAICTVLDGSPALLADARLIARSASGNRPSDAGARSLSPLIVATLADFVDDLPPEPLTGELPVADVRRMMFADHLAFGAIEWLEPGDADGLAALATQFQLVGIETAARGGHL